MRPHCNHEDRRDERRHALVPLRADEIEAMLRPLFPAGRLLSATVLVGGLINTNYRLTVRGFERPLVLRVYVGDAAACAREEAILRLVRGAVPVPEVLYAEPDAAPFGWPFAVMTWIEGTPMAGLVDAGDARTGEATGAVLAAIGRHRFSGPGFFGPRLQIEQPLHWRTAVVAEIERCLFQEAGQERLGAALTARLHGLVRRHAFLATDLPETASLVHADYRPANILFRAGPGARDVAGVLDWEWACSGPPLLDVATMMRGQSFGSAFGRSFVAAFRQGGGALPREWKKMVRLLDLVNLCQFLAWDPPRLRIIEMARQLIVRTLDEWPSLSPD